MRNFSRIMFAVLVVWNGHISMAQTSLTASQALDFWITRTETEVVGAAEAMPADKYSFAPTERGFTGVRTFAQQVKHLAANNYRMAAYITGRTPTSDRPCRHPVQSADRGLRPPLFHGAPPGHGHHQ